MQGSWWLAWIGWLKAHSGPPVAPPQMSAADAGYGVVGDAPGSYVMEK